MNKSLLYLFLLVFGVSFHVRGQVCPPTPGTEKITNGNFESGSAGFTNDITLCPGTCGQLGGDQYIIGTNPNTYNSGYFKSMADHSPTGSNMLIVDFADGSQNSTVYRTSVNVTAGKNYFFSAWFANIAINNNIPCATCPGGTQIQNPPILKFRIDGVDAGIVHVDSLSNDWSQFFTTFKATSTKSVTIEIVNIQAGNKSNDLALDDVSFTDGCDKITDLNSLGQDSKLPEQVLSCNVAFPLTLDPGLPSTYSLKWRNAAPPSADLGAGATYTVNSAPADGSRIYLCYEYIPGCPRTDTVTFKNSNIDIELGADKVMCAPVNYTIDAGVAVPPATITWYKNGAVITGANGASYTATDVGTYKATVARANCGTDTDQMTISSPTSTMSGTGSYCAANNTANFSVTGTTQAKWYTVPTGGTALNPSDTKTTITLPYNSTNKSVPGCSSGLYVEDVSSYPGATMPSAPCATTTNYGGKSATLVEVNQDMTISSVDFIQRTDWSSSGTFTFNIYANNPTAGPWCGSCVPPGTYDGYTNTATPLYTVTTPTLTATAPQKVQTITMPPNVKLAPGKYWFELNNTGGSYGTFDCQTTPANSTKWTTPVADNTGKNAMVAEASLKGGNLGGSGLFNIKFQVGSNNACSRLFICATENCPAPVEFLSFDVSRTSHGNALVWKTATEKNSAYFVIHRSHDGIHFESAGKVAAAGNSSSVLTYNYYDVRSEGNDIVYYRIQEVDLDGAVTYSPIRSLNAGDAAKELNVYPVPVHKGQALSINFFSDADEIVRLEVVDNVGKSIAVHEYAVHTGSNTLELQTATLNPGYYYLRLTGNAPHFARISVE